MEFPRHSASAAKFFRAFDTATRKKTGEQTDKLATIAESPKASCTSSAATWRDALDVQGKRFTASVRTTTV
jgi:hypothetical protein